LRFQLFKKIIIFSINFIMTEQTFGSKAQVWHGTAKKTSGGLTKGDLMKNKHGRIVSRRKHSMGKKSIKHLRKLGYIAKKGKFTLFHKGHKSRKMRGGANLPMANGQHSTSSSTNSNQLGPAAMAQRSGSNTSTQGTNSTTGNDLAKAMVASNLMSKTGGRRRSRKMRGGMAYGGPLSPHSYDGAGVGTSGVALQFVAGSSG
jgi:hypothetical protein